MEEKKNEQKNEQKNDQNQIELNDNLKAFIQKLMTDSGLAVRMSQCKSPEEAYAVASSVQKGFTMEEFVTCMQTLNDAVNGELSEEDLAKAAGGENYEDLIPASIASAIAVVTFSVYTASEAVAALSGAAV